LGRYKSVGKWSVVWVVAEVFTALGWHFDT